MNTIKEAQSINDFCDSHDISRSLFYKLKRQGIAPAIMKVGTRSLITADAAKLWRDAMESQTINAAT